MTERLFPYPLACLLACAPAMAQQTEVLCTDGSRIRGSLRGVETDRLHVEADFLAVPVPLRLDKVLQLSLPARRGDSGGDHLATLQLTNGDVLRGSLMGVDESNLTLRTWYAGDLVLRRAMVDALDIQGRPELLYVGPGTNLDGWKESEPGTWSVEGGWLRARGSSGLSRDVGDRDRVRVSFDLSWRSTPRLHVLVCSDDIGTTGPGNAYELMLQGGRYVQLNKRWKSGDRNGSVSMGNFANVPELMNKERCRFELLIDRKAGRVRMLVDERVVQDWSDPDIATGGRGGGIHFNTLDSTPMRIGRIEVSTWDGILEGSAPGEEEEFLEEGIPSAPQAVALDPTRIRLRNNDQLPGEMLGIEGGRMKIKAPFGEVSLPVSRLRTFMLHTTEQRRDPEQFQQPIRRNGDVRAWFADGSRITFRLTEAAEGKLTGDSQTFGTATFDQAAFSRIEFNLYEPDLDALRLRGDRW